MIYFFKLQTLWTKSASFQNWDILTVASPKTEIWKEIYALNNTEKGEIIMDELWVSGYSPVIGGCSTGVQSSPVLLEYPCATFHLYIELNIGSYLKVKGSTKNVVRFLVLVRGIFFNIIWKLIDIALFWAVALNFCVPSSLPKMALNPKKDLKLT